MNHKITLLAMLIVLGSSVCSINQDATNSCAPCGSSEYSDGNTACQPCSSECNGCLGAASACKQCAADHTPSGVACVPCPHG